MHEEWTDKLSDFLDDELPATERAALEAHLAECGACARTFDELTRVIAAARALAPRPPSRDLWSGISPQLSSAAQANRDAVGPFRRAQRRFSFAVWQLAAASALIAVVSGGLMWQLRGGPAGPPQNGGTAAGRSGNPLGSSAGPAAGASTDALMPIGFADAQYDAAVADLEAALQKGRDRLDKSTIAIVEQNLAIIDRAIDQARQALDSDPANAYLSSHLMETRRRKLDLLRRATALASETN